MSSKATIIASVHSASLANAGFMARNSIIMDGVDFTEPLPEFEEFAAEFGFHYLPFKVIPVRPEHYTGPSKDYDVEVDIEYLDMALSSLRQNAVKQEFRAARKPVWPE